MSTTTKNLTGTEAIEAFNTAYQDGQGVRVWSHHHVQKAMGSTDWSSAEYTQELLKEAMDDGGSYVKPGWVSAEWDGESLNLTHSDYWNYQLSYADAPDAGRRHVAYYGTHSEFDWEDESVASESLKLLLRYLGFDDGDLGKFGLASCDDFLYGDDGGFWLVADADKFGETAARCKAIDEEYNLDGLDGEDIEWILDGQPGVGG